MLCVSRAPDIFSPDGAYGSVMTLQPKMGGEKPNKAPREGHSGEGASSALERLRELERAKAAFVAKLRSRRRKREP